MVCGCSPSLLTSSAVRRVVSAIMSRPASVSLQRLSCLALKSRVLARDEQMVGIQTCRIGAAMADDVVFV